MIGIEFVSEKETKTPDEKIRDRIDLAFEMGLAHIRLSQEHNPCFTPLMHYP